MSSGTPFSSILFMKPWRGGGLEGCSYYQRHIESLDLIIFYTELRSTRFQLQASICIFCVVFLPPPRCPGLWRSLFLSESAPSKQTWAAKHDRHTVVTADAGSNQVNNQSRRSNATLTSVPSLLWLSAPARGSAAGPECSAPGETARRSRGTLLVPGSVGEDVGQRSGVDQSTQHLLKRWDASWTFNVKKPPYICAFVGCVCERRKLC